MINNLVEGKFGHGATPSPKDERDYIYGEHVGMFSVFDWDNGYDVEEEIGHKLVIKNQGSSSSCGGQAWSYHGEVLSAINNKIYKPKSAKFIYAQTFVPGGGSAGRTNSQLVKDKGFADESVCSSYDEGNPPIESFMQRKSDITPEAYSNGLKDTTMVYSNVPIDIDSIANALKNNNGVIIGVCGVNNGTWLSKFPLPPKNTNDVWRHWVYVGKAKLINGKKYIGFANSWGNVGDNGWQWISEDYMPFLFEVCTQQYGKSYPTLKVGAKGEYVKTLQTRLGITPDGIFGNKTLKAVKDFQSKNNLISDGIVGIKTWNKLQHKNIALSSSILDKNMLYFNGMNTTIKKYITSSVVTFISGFALAIYPSISSLQVSDIKNGTLLGLIFAGTRAGVKALIEYFFIKK